MMRFEAGVVNNRTLPTVRRKKSAVTVKVSIEREIGIEGLVQQKDPRIIDLQEIQKFGRRRVMQMLRGEGNRVR